AALMPEVSAAIGRRDRSAITMMTFSTIAVSAILVVPFALGFVIFGRWGVWIWSNHLILPSFITVLGVGLSILFSGFWFPLSNLILAADKQGSYTGIYAALAIVSLPISYVVARQIGGGGVALSMAFVDGLMLMLILRLTETHLAYRHEILAAAPKAGGHFLALSRKVVARNRT
ncbi:MAG: hypothetical protein P4M15_03075, partial [Alphaproteobacteria bacterium]|nr:hypothetical protein [Alphaproteobacteria bacterium]